MAFDWQNDKKPDDFWDLSALIPPKKSVLAPPSRGTDTEPALVESAPRGKPAGEDVPLCEHYIFPHTASEELSRPAPWASYVPKSPLLHAVRIYEKSSAYTYYDRFRQDAIRLYAREGIPAQEVDFFSYMPQYAQMSSAQLDYYLWWRANFRTGTILPAADSYLLLYLYEIINLDTLIAPEAGQEYMVRLWLSYRERHPRLDAPVRELVIDYSLLHRLPPPRLPHRAYRELLEGCRLREFYVTPDEGKEALIAAILQFGNNYDYRKSKFYRPDTAADFERVLGGAVGVALAVLQDVDGEKLMKNKEFCTVTRDILVGVPCPAWMKCKIEIDYTSFSRTHHLRYIMTDVLKYAENALRASLGVKSRLTVYEVSTQLRTALDAWLKDAVPARKKATKRVEIPAYELRYEPPRITLSPERAAQIEAASWSTTQELVEAFGGDAEEQSAETVQKTADFEPVFPFESAPTQALDADSSPNDLATALGDLVPFLRLIDAGDVCAQRQFAKERHTMPDALLDRINTIAEEHLGDIIVEDTDRGPALVEDYREILSSQGVLGYGTAK